MLLISIIAVLIIVITAVVFAVQNADIILVNFFFWDFQGSLALILLLSFILGFAVSLLIIFPKLIKRNFIISNQKKEIKELLKKEKERLEQKNIAQQQEIEKTEQLKQDQISSK